MESQWRITEQNPIRSGPGRMDFERCAALHNEIIERGWIGSGRALQDLNRTTYWERWHDSPEWNSEHYHPSVAEFFQLAIAGPGSHSFFYTVGGLLGPGGLFDRLIQTDADQHRFINLYSTTLSVASSGVGIVLDQHTFQAIFQPSTDEFSSCLYGNRIQWQPLETILGSFLDMIDQGKAVALPQRPPPIDDMGRARGKPWEAPWLIQSFTEEDLRATLSNFERLVEAIESRMPPGSLPDIPIGYGCLDVVEGEEPSESLRMIHKHDFARRFLSAVRRPRLQFIAPGLTCVGGGLQPFASKDYTNNSPRFPLRPVLLACGDEPIAEEQFGLTYFYQDASDVPCGLYLTELDHFGPMPFEDGCRLELPFHIGRDRHGRRSDGTFFGEGQTAMPLSLVRQAPSRSDVHQQGYNPFIGWHDVQLKHMLERWIELVETGYWKVDEHGVAGGIEKWKEADSEEHWQKYQLPVRW